MQVKKFEAKTMKEALQLVKTHLGPEAIILAARDHSKGFGLLGERSVEITAAVSNEGLVKKMAAEKKLREQTLQKYQTAPARVQRDYIERSFARSQPQPPRPQPTSQRYIEIDNTDSRLSGDFLRDFGKEDGDESDLVEGGSKAQARIKKAAVRALKAWDAEASDTQSPTVKIPQRWEGEALNALQSEIRSLKEMLLALQQGQSQGPTRHPGFEYDLPFEVSETFARLVKTGMAAESVSDILKKAQKELPFERLRKKAHIEGWVASHLLDIVEVSKSGSKSMYQVYCGATGQGKTSTLVKAAAHQVIRQKQQVAIVTMDNSKFGAAEQLKIYSQILNIPFAVIRKPGDWQALRQKLPSIQSIFVDTPSSSLSALGDMEEFQSLLPPPEKRDLHLVVSALAKEEEAFEVASRYKALGVSDVIFTHVDQAFQHGIIFNFQRRFKLPLHSFGTGARIPEDLEPATKERFVDLIFQISKFKNGSETRAL